MKTCIACGMPMKNKSDFAMSDESRTIAFIAPTRTALCTLLKRKKRA